MKNSPRNGAGELRAVRRQSRRIYWFVGIFSFAVNALMLTGPLYMMQVYDRVLGSRSEATLLVLSLIVGFLYAMMGVLEHVRARLLARAGARFQAGLDGRVFRAMVHRSAVAEDEAAETGLQDLEAVQRLMASPAMAAAFDLPWTPLFLLVICAFHPLLGVLAVAGGAVLVALAVANQALTRAPQAQASGSSHRAGLLSEEIRGAAEMIRSMGMLGAAFDRWKGARDAALADSMAAGGIGGGFGVAIKVLRMGLQSAMLGLGAWLVLQGNMSGGSMIAGSVLMGRALAPVETAIGQWALVQRAVKGWQSLAGLLTREPAEEAPLDLPRPEARLEVEGLAIAGAGEAPMPLQGVSFRIEPGQVTGVIGPSGAGKSTLARAVTGTLPSAAGTIRLGGAGLGQYGAEMLGRHIGYLPQQVRLFEGTIAQNIARLAAEPNADAVVKAAQRADAHQMITALPQGYDTPVGMAGAALSGGQMQRIALARALYGDPVLVLLDEPNSNLDAEGTKALHRAIAGLREAGKAVMIMTHRPTALQECDMILALDQGRIAAYGPRETMLRPGTATVKTKPTPIKSMATAAAPSPSAEGTQQCA